MDNITMLGKTIERDRGLCGGDFRGREVSDENFREGFLCGRYSEEQ